MSRVGTRELRADLAAMVRRAAAGQRVVVTVGGRPAAVLGPVVHDDTGPGTLDALVTAGLLVPPRRTDGFRPGPAIRVWSGIRLDRALRDVRG